MTVKGGTTPACAACKYRRRKCTPTCPLALYFPADQPKTFRNVHRLFGVSSITKTLSGLKTGDEKEDAMKSIIFEAETRERFPVHGCSVIMDQLNLQLQCAIEELKFVHSLLAICKEEESNKQADYSLCSKEQQSNKQGDYGLCYKEQQSNKQGDYKEQQSNKLVDSSLCLGTDIAQVGGNKVINYAVDQFLNNGFYNAESLEPQVLRSDIKSNTNFFPPLQILEFSSKEQPCQGDLKNAAAVFTTVK